jgi:hypothetical protein
LQSRTDDDANLLDNFWYKIAGIYGATWAAKYGEAPEGSSAEAWLHTLKAMGPRRVAIGLRCCLSDPGDYPPTPGRFRKTAEENDHPAYSAPKVDRISVQPAEAAVSAEYLSKIRRELGIGGSDA